MTSTLPATDFHYVLPERLIARYPNAERTQSRLLVLNRSNGNLAHQYFTDLSQYIRKGDLLVLNDTRVMRARLRARKSSGGMVEITVENILSPKRAQVYFKASKSPQEGSKLHVLKTEEVLSDMTLDVVSKSRDNVPQYDVELSGDMTWEQTLEHYGELPLPPYLKRGEEAVDRSRYHTVYAKRAGAVAAPTAGLHFSEDLLDKLATQGVNIAYITLHVGYGTFAPIFTSNILSHKMHAERLCVSSDVCDKILSCRAEGNRVIAVGTTVVRALETAAMHSDKHEIEPYEGATRLFIYPGYQFKITQGMITNFHQPNTTLLPLVAAFAGTKEIMHAYNEAIAHDYRFLSYGDAMLIGDWF